MLQAMPALNTYSGLVCVHKDIADYVVDNTGKVFTATHPSTAHVISGISNKDTLNSYAYRPSIILNGVGDIVKLANENEK